MDLISDGGPYGGDDPDGHDRDPSKAELLCNLPEIFIFYPNEKGEYQRDKNAVRTALAMDHIGYQACQSGPVKKETRYCSQQDQKEAPWE